MNKTRAVAVNWDADEESEIDERISQMISDALDRARTKMWTKSRLIAEFFLKPFFINRNLRTLNNQIGDQNFMPEIEIEINAETGEMETTIKGIAGPACEKTAEAIKQVFGKPVAR